MSTHQRAVGAAAPVIALLATALLATVLVVLVPVTAADAARPAATAAHRAGTVTQQRADRRRHHRPVVKRVRPATGPAAGGTVVRIRGAHLTGVKKVLFGSSLGRRLLVKNGHKLVVTSPAHTPGQVAVRLVSHSGTSKKTSRGRFVYVASGGHGGGGGGSGGVPVVKAVSPGRGPAAGGTVVSLTGTGFTRGAVVTFGGTPGTALVLTSSTQLSITTPAHAAGVVDVLVRTEKGTSAAGPADRFTYGAGSSKGPRISSLSPSSGPVAGGIKVTITGTSFTGATAVHFGSAPASALKVVSDSSITVKAPPGAAGQVAVTVTTAAGTSPGVGYTYAATPPPPPPPPAPSGASPLLGTSAGGTKVTITGSGLTGATSVTFGGVAGTSLVVNSDSSLTVLTPPHAPALVTIVVTTPGGSAAVPVQFLYL